MSDEIRELRNEIIALKEINGKLERNNAELIVKIDKLMEENQTLKAEKSQQNLVDSIIAIPTLHSDEKMSNEFSVEVKSKHLTKRFIPNWLVEVLAWINRIEMANSSLSISSETFRQLCWPKLHLNVKPHKIMRLEFSPARYEFDNFRALLKRGWNNNVAIAIPIASIPPPEYIVGIRKIDIKFLDDQVVNFVKNIAHFLHNCHIRLRCEIPLNSWKTDKKMIVKLQSLMKCLGKKISKLELSHEVKLINGYEWKLNDFNQFFPGILDHVEFLSFQPRSTLEHSENVAIILNWLTKQSKKGIQKMMNFNSPKHILFFINAIKTEFCNSNSPSNFFICFNFKYVFVQEFTLENAQTNEILALYHQGFLYLSRYPKGEEYWKKDGYKKMKIYREHETYINIEV